jgi:2-polyprenyl-3-methyl-5-hydroxy-6-metoxy-1,4-benzoquinol methylase
MSISQIERATYEDIWSAVDSYGRHAPGEQYLPLFLQCLGDVPRKGATVLDAGTGSGKGAVALSDEGFNVRMCDMTDAGLVEYAKALPFYELCLWHDLSPATWFFGYPGRTKAEYVYCTDVLEHIPPQFTMLAVHQMLAVCSKGLFLTVSLVPDNFGVWLGKSLHQSVFPFTWWRDALREVGTVVDARDLISNAVFFVEPRR